MKKSILKWEQINRKYETGHEGKAGGIKLFSVIWNSSTSQTDNNKYKLTCFLPGIKDNLGNYETLGKAQARAEQALEYWVRKVGLEIEQRD